jgi:hypothetical protein
LYLLFCSIDHDCISLHLLLSSIHHAWCRPNQVDHLSLDHYDMFLFWNSIVYINFVW